MQTRPRPVKYRRKNKLRFVHKPSRPNIELRPHQVIIRPLVTEKGTFLSTKLNAYTFQVSIHATKTDIKNAIQEMFPVRVEAVRTQIRHGKKRRFRFKEGSRPDWKKAIIKLHPDDKIEFF
jgi:large subunit ribosomal protein L23